MLEELKDEVAEVNHRLAPTELRLDIVMVGDNQASHAFVKRKKQAGARIGVLVKIHHFEETMSTAKLRKEVSQLGRDQKVHGIVIQLPLPDHINEQYILDTVPPQKDVDVLGYKAAGKFYTKARTQPILPSTLSGIIKLLESYEITDFRGRNVVVVGAGKLVGTPALNFFMRKDDKDATVINVCRHTRDLDQFFKMADVVISGAGSPKFIEGDMLKPGVIVVDAGSSKDSAGKLVGDVDFESVEPIASYITPVPGGVGPMTVAMIFYNLVQLAKHRLKIK